MAAAALKKGGQEEDDSDHRRDAADSSSFKLLNELGDLLMLPTDMLLGNIMKETGTCKREYVQLRVAPCRSDFHRFRNY
ncbi:hypothetical protein E2562_012176 [Oryza meyeriana var. granulata]|uniref:Uncharacterized protein n=1 Tax=Oryza meyeriana var. granulata TaxID=110450 RepID=A0A6G1F7M0_9ORYZ|nr:hypothetical protein E2562_012176 [Oryza meyeriana var. granulata]